MIAQIIAHGPGSDATAKKLVEYLERVSIRGIATNIPLLRRILRDDVFLDGVYDTDYLPRFFERVDMDTIIGEIAEASGAADASIGAEAIAIEGSDEVKVLSPSTGIFYTSPSPTEAPYVSVGETISIDATMCQIEAFKIFTPLRLVDYNNVGAEPLYSAEREYEVTRVNVTTGQQINPGDLLFVVRPKGGGAAESG